MLDFDRTHRRSSCCSPLEHSHNSRDAVSSSPPPLQRCYRASRSPPPRQPGSATSGTRGAWQVPRLRPFLHAH